MIKRRDFIIGIGSSVVWPAVGLAQQVAVPVIGYLGSNSKTAELTMTSFRKGLNESGYVEGKNVEIESRWINGQPDQVPAIIKDFVKRRVSVIAVVSNTAAALAAKAGTQTIPIVFRIAGDPVALGLVAALNRPGGNVTGITTLGSELTQKRLEMLREIVPAGSTVAALVNPNNANAEVDRKQLQGAAQLLRLKLLIIDTGNAAEIDAAFLSMAKRNVSGIVTTAENLFFQQREQLISLVARKGVPAIYSDRLFCETGGLMCYGTDIIDGHYRAGTYVARILKGTKPADLPVQQSVKAELVVNLKTAQMQRLKMAPTLLVRADKVIE